MNEIKSGKTGKKSGIFFHSNKRLIIESNVCQLVEFHVKFCLSQNVSQNFENSLHPNL